MNDFDVKREARQQYIKYFKVWFVILAVVLVAAVVRLAVNLMQKEEVAPRTNLDAPTERVYDGANVLSDAEEEKLRELIAKAEAQIQCDIVVMTIKQPVEGKAAQEQFGYRYTDWERNMRDIADDFFDYSGYGYDNIHYSGALILDNWYDGQAGTWLSTTGAVYERFGNYEIDEILDIIYYEIDGGGSAYRAYADAVEKIVYYMDTEEMAMSAMWEYFLITAIVVPIVTALIFIFTKLKVKEGEITTNSNTYVDGSAKINVQRDEFIRKSVSTRVIQTSSSGGGGGGGGRGGSHRSSSGRSHGGGGRRR